MDFGQLLHVAKKNSQNTKTADGKFYSTKFSAPKKESKEKRLSNNIKRFLEKKEQEEQEKARQEREKLNNLLSMRDEKSKNKIRKMLKVTKSANRSVLDDAKDLNHTAVTMNGLIQPDEDDYGYVSKEASAFFQKYVDKVGTLTDEIVPQSRPRSKDLGSTKDRVKAAILRQQEEKHSSSRSRTASSSAASTNSSSKPTKRSSKYEVYDPEKERDADQRRKREEKHKAKRPPAPPVMDFKELLKLAEKKQFEPIEVKKVEVKKEPERLLTKKEKLELELRKQFEDEKEKKKVDPIKVQKMEPNGRIPKLNGSSAKLNLVKDEFKKPVDILPKTSSLSSVGSSRTLAQRGSTRDYGYKPLPIAKQRDTRPKELPPRPLQEKTRQFPPLDVRKSRPDDRKKNKRRIYDDDEDEYDSEMDDFIDDEHVDDTNKISDCIKSIFDYDRNKYKYVDEEDDAAMESNFVQQMREEAISKKIGLKEDLEDIRREEEKKKLKLNMLKKKKYN